MNRSIILIAVVIAISSACYADEQRTPGGVITPAKVEGKHWSQWFYQ